jgi:hypothetical protein
MMQSPSIDGVLIQWGDRLFYPGNRLVTPSRSRRSMRLQPVDEQRPFASELRPPSPAERLR